jgi:hypothetical protein
MSKTKYLPYIGGLLALLLGLGLCYRITLRQPYLTTDAHIVQKYFSHNQGVVYEENFDCDQIFAYRQLITICEVANELATNYLLKGKVLALSLKGTRLTDLPPRNRSVD